MASAEEARKAMLSVSSMVKEVIGMGGKTYAKDSLSEIGRLFEQAEQSYREGEFDDTVGYAKRVARLSQEAREKCRLAGALSDRIAKVREKVREALASTAGNEVEEELLGIESLAQKAENVLKNKTGLQEGVWLVEEAEDLLSHIPQAQEDRTKEKAAIGPEVETAGSTVEETEPEELVPDLDEESPVEPAPGLEEEAELLKQGDEEGETVQPQLTFEEEEAGEEMETEEAEEAFLADETGLERLRDALGKAQERLTNLEKSGAIELAPALYRRAFRALTDAEDLIAETEEEETLEALRTAEEAMTEMEGELTRSTDAQKGVAETHFTEVQEILQEIEATGGKRFVEDSVGVIAALMESSQADMRNEQWELALGKLDRALNNAQDALDEAKRMRQLEDSYNERLASILPKIEQLEGEEAEKYAPESFFEIDRALNEAKELAEENRLQEAEETLSRTQEALSACEEEMQRAKEKEARRLREEAITQRLDALEGKSLDELEAEGAPTYLPNEYKTAFKSLNAARRTLRRGQLDEAEKALEWSEQAMEKLRTDLAEAKENTRTSVEGLLSKSSQILEQVEGLEVSQVRSLQIRALRELLSGLQESGDSSWKAIEQQAHSLTEQAAELKEELLELQAEMEEAKRRQPEVTEGIKNLMDAGAESYVPEDWHTLLSLKEEARQAEEAADFKAVLGLYERMTAMFPKMLTQTQQEKERERQEALEKLSQELDLLERELEEMEKLEVIQYMPAEYRTVCKAFKEAGQAFRREEVEPAKEAIQNAQKIISTLKENLGSKLDERKGEVEEELDEAVGLLEDLEANEAEEYVPEALQEARAVIDSVKECLSANQLGTAEENVRNAKFKISEAARKLSTIKELHEKAHQILGQAKAKLRDLQQGAEAIPAHLRELEEEIQQLLADKRFELAVMKSEEFSGLVGDWETQRAEEAKAKEKSFRREKAIVAHTLSEIQEVQGERLYPELYRELTETQLLADKLAEEGQWDEALQKLERTEELAEGLLDKCEEAAEEDGTSSAESGSALHKELSGIQDILTGLKTAVGPENAAGAPETAAVEEAEQGPEETIVEEPEPLEELDETAESEDAGIGVEEISDSVQVPPAPEEELELEAQEEEAVELEAVELDVEEEPAEEEAREGFFRAKEDVEDILFSISEKLDTEEEFAACEEIRNGIREAHTMGTEGDWRRANEEANELLARIQDLKNSVANKTPLAEAEEEPIPREAEALEPPTEKTAPPAGDTEEVINRLSEMCEGWGVTVAREVISLIARELPDKPDLHGDVLQSILSRSLLTGQRIDVALARDVLDEYMK